SSGGKVTNSGTIKVNSFTADAIQFTGAAGGTVTNTGANALIFSQYGSAISIANAGTVINSGSIRGYNNYGVVLGSGSINNSGNILAAYKAIKLGSDGTVTNTGAIQSFYGISSAGTGTVFNAGTIFGSFGNGIDLAGGGYISNSSTGTITAGA